MLFVPSVNDTLLNPLPEEADSFKKGFSMRKMTQRTEAVIRLDALAHNISEVRKKIKPQCELMAVLKGDGYGHGIAGIYSTFEKCGADSYAVAIWEEGALLRQLGCKKPILILGDTCNSCMNKLIEFGLSQTVFSMEQAELLNEVAKQNNGTISIHLKIDTGMSRLGFPVTEASAQQVSAVSKLSNLKIDGAFTHFAKADEEDGIVAKEQLGRYLCMVGWLEKLGIVIPKKHVSNSPAILLRPEANLDAVRSGDIIFALCPVEEDRWTQEDFKQVLHWYTQVAMVKTVPEGTEVGYGGTFVTKRTTTIATIPVGFADGYSRRLSNKGFVKIRRKRAPIIGRVCMDQFMVDVTDIDGVTRGDTVTLLDDDLSILWMADLIDANVDEIVCGISKRVPRVYE